MRHSLPGKVVGSEFLEIFPGCWESTKIVRPQSRDFLLFSYRSFAGIKISAILWKWCDPNRLKHLVMSHKIFHEEHSESHLLRANSLGENYFIGGSFLGIRILKPINWNCKTSSADTVLHIWLSKRTWGFPNAANKAFFVSCPYHLE